MCSYPNQILVEYNVQCDAGKAAFVRFDTLDLEPRNCYDGKEFRYSTNLSNKYMHAGQVAIYTLSILHIATCVNATLIYDHHWQVSRLCRYR